MWPGFVVERPCATFLATGEDIISGEGAGERSGKDTKMARDSFPETI